jgi:thiamine pyrophosphokinase
MEAKRSKGVILCNGQMPGRMLIEPYLNEDTLFVAADGGANRAAAVGLRPDVIIGDLDSYEPIDYKEHKVEVILDANQETNDLEKALEYLKEQSIKEVRIFGATNMRLDHTLKNLSVLLRYHTVFEYLELVDIYGYCFVLPKKFSASYNLGTVVSLLPINGRVSGIKTKGLKYPLNDEFLENGLRDGSSNEVIAEQVEISYTEGDLLFFVAS